MALGLLGKKLGMTRVYDDSGVSHPCTVVHVGGNVVTQVKTADADGYEAVQIGYEDVKESRAARPHVGHCKKAGSAPKRFVREFRGAAEIKAGDAVPVTTFSVGQFVDVIGISKGKGFQGVVRRHGHKGQPATHGSMMHRRTGAIGCRSTPGRIWKNQGMPGHMGDTRITTQNLRVLQVREDDQVIVIRGAVPGANGSFLIIRGAKKKPVKAKS
ncbi:MAG: 50S ribosomal protein L3 [Verrucomicrobiae bacterium]|nr:50S ribosomal protein L3 [Verrucomicrobiae bacterium]